MSHTATDTITAAAPSHRVDFDVSPDVIERARSFAYTSGREGVLLVHGFAGTVDNLRPLAKFLYTKGFTVLGLRLAGHGTSIEDLATTSAIDWKQSLEQGIGWLQQRCDRVSIIGASMGGNLALLRSLHQHDIDKIVLLGTPLTVRGHWWKQVLVPVIVPFKKYYDKDWVKTDEDRRIHQEAGSYLRVSLRAFTSALKVFAQTKKVLPQITVPVLMVYAKHDEVINPRSAEHLYQRLGSQHKRLYWVDGSDHQPHESEKREVVFEHIYHFLTTRDR